MNDIDYIAAMITQANESDDPLVAAGHFVRSYLAAKAAIKDLSRPFDEVAAEAKRGIKDVLEELGVSKIETPAGMAYIPKDGVSVSYDVVGLDALCKASPELREILVPFRIEKATKGALTVR